MEEPVFDARLQKERDAHAAFSRRDERTAKVCAWKKIRGRDQYFGARGADGRQISTFDVAAVTQVVANQKLCRLRAGAWCVKR